MKRLTTWANVSLLSLFGLLTNPLPIHAQCGGTERWAVKVGTDPGASNVDLTSRSSMNLLDLIAIPEPQRPPAHDNTTRLDAETHVFVVRARLVKFKFEANDNDYHLVITDDTLNFTKGGAAPPSRHSFVAEIPDPNCIAGTQGSPSAQSLFIDGIRNARNELAAQFPNIDTSGQFNDAGGIPVEIVGVGFFDFPHKQVGRAPNNIEIHPVLDIRFNPSPGTFTLSVSPAQLSIPQGGSASSVITTSVASGLNAAITFSVAGAPVGGSVTFSPTFIPPPGSGSSTLSLMADPSTSPGNYSLKVSGTGGGGVQTATIAVSVTPIGSPPSTTVTAPTDGATVSGVVSVNAAPSGSGAVKLEIYIDGALKACNFGATSISYPWDTTAAANGAHAVMSKGYNAAGTAASSATVNVTVSN